MSDAAVREGHVLAVLAELADRADGFIQKLDTQLAEAESVRQSITRALDALHAAKADQRRVRGELAKAHDSRDDARARAAEAGEISERAGRRLKELQQMIDYGVEDAQIFSEMGRAASAQKDKAAERDRMRARVETAEAKMAACEAQLKAAAEAAEARAGEVKSLQKSLPDPHLFAWIGLAHLGRANAHLLLHRDPSRFDRLVREGAEAVLRLHREMREGRYRLDRYGDLLAGRHEATVQTMYGAVAAGDLKLASEIFSLAADPGMYFHHIFNVFRTWLLGAYLLGDRRVIAELLKVHRYDKGVWRGYVRCFSALLGGDARGLNDGLRIILKIEQRRDDLVAIPGLTLVHLPATAIARLARARQIAIEVRDPALPQELLKW